MFPLTVMGNYKNSKNLCYWTGGSACHGLGEIMSLDISESELAR